MSYVNFPPYKDIVNILSERGDEGATFAYIKEKLKDKGYSATSMVQVMMGLEKDNKINVKWHSEPALRKGYTRSFKIYKLNRKPTVPAEIASA